MNLIEDKKMFFKAIFTNKQGDVKMAGKLNKDDSSSNLHRRKNLRIIPASFSPLSLSASRKIFKDIQR